jgi:hypothetical protein
VTTVHAAPIARHEPGVGHLHVWPLVPTEALLERLLRDLFETHWRGLTFGPIVQGSAWEIQATAPPWRIGMMDGYLTVDLGHSHFHVCIGEHRGSPHAPVSPELARHRRTGRAELYRRVNADGAPDSWGLRLFNGADEQQITVLFPNPFLDDEHRFLPAPDWSRLAAWDHVRATYLGLPPDPFDRTGTRFIHS